MRIKDNQLYWDWPWGRHRTSKYQQANYNGTELLLVQGKEEGNLFRAILRILKVEDSVFLMGGERSILPWLLPFPSFSFAPKLTNSEMPYPWLDSLVTEWNLYRRASENNNFSDAFFELETNQKPWHERTPKAAFYSTYRKLRRVIWDQAALRPDLIDANNIDGTIYDPKWPEIDAWNMRSKEPRFANRTEALEWAHTHPFTEPGFPSFLSKINPQETKSYTPGHFKYIVVTGYYINAEAESTTGRLLHLLAHSGAVIILQEQSARYHPPTTFIFIFHSSLVHFSDIIFHFMITPSLDITSLLVWYPGFIMFHFPFLVLI